MADFKDELEDIPQEVEKIFSGDISIGGKKVPKILILGAVLVIGAVIFVVLKNKGSGNGKTGNSLTSNIPNAFTPDSSSGSGSSEGGGTSGSGGNSSTAPTSGDLINSIPLPNIPLPDFGSVSLPSLGNVSYPDYTQSPPVPYMSTGSYGDYSPAMDTNFNTGILGVPYSGDTGNSNPNVKLGGVFKGVKVNTPVTKVATPNNPLYKPSGNVNLQNLSNYIKPAVISVKPITNAFNLIGNFIGDLTGRGNTSVKPAVIPLSKKPSITPSKPIQPYASKPSPIIPYIPYYGGGYTPYKVPPKPQVAVSATKKTPNRY